MLIHCTRKLLDEMKIKPIIYENEDPLFSWHANLIRVNGRKTVVLMNDSNRYVIVLYGLKASDFKRLDDIIIQAIRETLQEEHIRDEVIAHYIDHAQKVTYTKTKDRSAVAKLNWACDSVFFYQILIKNRAIIQSDISLRINRLPVGAGSNNYIYPNRELYQDLESLVGHPVFGCKAVVLKVTMDLERHSVWRRIAVPVNSRFSRFHRVLQAAFGWRDYHLHEFYIYGSEKHDNRDYINHPGYHREGYRLCVCVVDSEEAFEYGGDVPMVHEADVILADYIPAPMKYTYDFGDNWQHYIEVESVIDDYDKNYPVCLAGEGNAPPEDVGGEYGYEEFLTIMADKKHPEHDQMAAWAASQGYKDFNIEQVNRAIRYNY
jgi:hypothetical protein